ncbi:MAG: prepilin peptidase [Candidatus Goldiibacteriota bacterium]
MEIYGISLFLFFFGTLIGSFFNVCIYRVQVSRSVVFPGSFCPACGKPIKWYDNIPVLSYLVLKGSCRACKKHISIRYPIVEFLTGILFVLIFLKFGLEKNYFFNIMIVGYLIIFAFIDIDSKIVPDNVLVFMFFTVLAANMGELNNINFFEGAAGGIAGGMIFYFLSFFSNGKIGEGDIKLITILGFAVGFAGILEIIFYSFMIGGAAALLLVLMKKSKRKDEMAFVPYISAAFVVQILIN